jgi:hypothetical protein
MAAVGTFETWRMTLRMSAYEVPAQPVDATQALNISAGFIAATRTVSGEPVVTRTFDPTVEETLFFPRLVGG